VARQEGILRLLRTASIGGAAAFVWLVVASELVALALALLARGRLGRPEGALLTAGYVVYVALAISVGD
jgi:hypothetical protein